MLVSTDWAEDCWKGERPFYPALLAAARSACRVCRSSPSHVLNHSVQAGMRRTVEYSPTLREILSKGDNQVPGIPLWQRGRMVCLPACMHSHVSPFSGDWWVCGWVVSPDQAREKRGASCCISLTWGRLTYHTFGRMRCRNRAPAHWSCLVEPCSIPFTLQLR